MRHALFALLLATTPITLAGCRTQQVFAHGFREIQLTRETPLSKEAGLELVQIEPDGAALFRLDNGREVRARVGERLGGTTARLAGSRPAEGAVTLEVRWVE